MKKYEELTIRDHFMFGKICTSKENSQIILRSLLNHEINLENTDIEKYLKDYSDGKFIRLDLIAKDDSNNVYNAEMQNESKNKNVQLELPKRNRYYHSMIDSANVKEGVSYKDMPSTIVIFICTYDPFGLNLPQYTFTMQCNEHNIPDYDDGATSIFFNTTADLSSLPQSTRSMLEYIQTGQTDDEATTIINEAIKEARLKDEWRTEYMLTLVHDNDIYTDGYSQGQADGYNQGQADGYNQGESDGYNQGQTDGYNQGQADGYTDGILSEIYSSVQDGDYSIARGAEKAGVPVDDFETNMTKAGYKLPAD